MFFFNFSSFVCLEFSVTYIFTELEHNFILGPAEDYIWVRDFLAALKTHWWPSKGVYTLVGLLPL